MKKIFAIFLCFVVMFTFCSCKKTTKKTSSGNSSSSKTVSQEKSSNNTSQNSTTTSSENNNSSQTPSTTSSTPSTTSSTPSSSSGVSQQISGKQEEKIEEVVEQIPTVDEDEDLEEDLVLGEDYGAFLYEGTFVASVNDKNVVYFIFKSPNTMVAYDTDKLDVTATFSLPDRPAEIQVDGNNLLISFPDMKCIKVYNKKTFAQTKSISLPNEVSSFCIDGDIVYYSEDDQHCKVYRTNLATNETKTIKQNNTNGLFYFPKLLLNKEKGLLYIGESGSTGSTLYYYKTSDLSLHSKFAKNNYGLTNIKRTMFLVDNNVFWGGFRLGADSAENVIGDYSGESTYFADKNFVITRNGIFDTKTYEFITSIDDALYASVTANESLVTVFKHYPGDVVVVLPG